MKSVLFAITFIAAFSQVACSHAASTPAALAKAFQTALDKGDFEAAGQLAELGGAPAQLQFLYFKTVSQCADKATCTVTTEVADDAMREAMKEKAKKMNAEAPLVDGMIKVALTSKDGTGSGSVKMPYAKVGSDYRITSIHFLPAEFDARRARTDQALVDELFAEGIRDGSSAEARKDWSTASPQLRAGGGEPGKAFEAQTKAMSAAVDAKDPDAAVRFGRLIETYSFRDKDSSGKPIPLVDRRRNLYVQSLKMLRDVNVKGGYLLDDRAVLVIDARDGTGWIVRGPIVVARDGNIWEHAGGNTVNYPASS